MFIERHNQVVAPLAAVTLALGLMFSAEPASALTTDEILNYKGADRQKVHEEGARKEGAVVIYSSMIVNQLLRPMTEAFKKKYPFIDIKYYRGDTSQVVSKINAEIQGDALVADVVEGSGLRAGTGKTQIVAPFYSKEFDVLPKDNIAPDSTWAVTRYRYIAVGYNTRYIPKNQAPKNYQDLLDPKWRGKMAWNAGSESSGAQITITALRAAWGDQKTEEYLEKLGKQQVAPLSISNRAVMDRVVQGEYWIGLGISAHHPIISASQGAPVTTVLFEPVPALSGAVQVVKGLKHPHAAMLLVDFLLSKEAQEMLQDAEYFPSNPEVPPSDLLKPIIPSQVGMPQIQITPEMIMNDTARSSEMYKKYFR